MNRVLLLLAITPPMLLSSVFAASAGEVLEDTLVDGVCLVSEYLLDDLDHAPLYKKGTMGECVEADLAEASGVFYSDTACAMEVSFTSTSAESFCDEATDPKVYGNAARMGSKDQYWTLNPGTRLDIALDEIKGNYEPFMTRANYRQVETPAGTCELEMRIYKRSLADTGLKPLMMIHGGSWQYRGSGFLGQETLVSHYTDAGFVVFAPFYRLAGDKDGNVECQNASNDDIMSDADAALDWVESNGARYGAASGKVSVSGQSAGAFMAAYLATTRSGEIERALLLYPPTDFVNYLESLQQSDNENAQGKSALEAFMGKPLDELSVSDADVVTYSLPQQVQNQAGTMPPVFMLHGVSDALVPATQSVRFCNALSGAADSGPASLDGGTPAEGTYSKQFQCDDQGSQLYLIAEADHVLDVCIDNAFISECPSGGKESRVVTRAALQASVGWLAEATAGAATSDNGDSTGANGASSGSADSVGDSAGGGAFSALLPLISLLRRRHE